MSVVQTLTYLMDNYTVLCNHCESSVNNTDIDLWTIIGVLYINLRLTINV